jgi:hypothetical protein
MFRDEAQIATAGLYFGCFGLEFVAGEVEVYLLRAEFEGVAFDSFAGYEGLVGHA